MYTVYLPIHDIHVCAYKPTTYVSRERSVHEPNTPSLIINTRSVHVLVGSYIDPINKGDHFSETNLTVNGLRAGT